MKRCIRMACLASAVILCVLAARGGDNRPQPAPALEEPKLTLKLFSMPDPRNTAPFNQADLAVLREFERRHPNYTLKRFSGIQIEGMGLDSAPLMAIAGGTSPDIIYVNFRMSETYISQGFLLPMDEFIEGKVAGVPAMGDEEKKFRVPDSVWPVINRKGPDGKAHVWAMPTDTLVRALLYRKDNFVKAGLDPNKPPRNWDEFMEYARKLTNTSERTYGLNLCTGSQAAWDYIGFLWSAGGEAVIFDEKDNRWKASFDSPEAVTAMRFYTKLVADKWIGDNGKVQHGYVVKGDATAWSEGRIAMFLTYLDSKSIGGGSGIDPSVMGIAPLPLGPTGKGGGEINCPMMGIFAGQKDPAVRKAAYQYIAFIDSEDARRIRVDTMVRLGFAKMMSPVYLRRYGYEEYLNEVPKEWESIWNEALKRGKPEPFGRNCQMIYNFMTYPMDEVVELEYQDKLGETEEAKRETIAGILHKAVARTNEEMIGYVPPDKMQFRRTVAFIAAIIVLSIFSAVLYKVWKIFTPTDVVTLKSSGGWGFKRYWLAYVIMLPAVGSVLLWNYVPMAMGTAIAFMDYRIVGGSIFVGLDNFASVLFDVNWWSALGKTLLYMILALCLGFWPPILLAVLLQEVSYGKIVYRTLFYLPAVISGFVVIYLWKLFYSPADYGIFNQLLGMIGVENLRWLSDPSLAMLCCILPSVWAGMGPGCLIYLAALKGIPDDMYEAAELDGASFLQKIRHIVVPSLKALIIIQFIGAFIASAQSGGFILVMTFGGPNQATQVAELEIFQKAYLYLKFGTAVTMAWVLGVALLGFTVLQLRKLSNMEFKTTGSI